VRRDELAPAAAGLRKRRIFVVLPLFPFSLPLLPLFLHLLPSLSPALLLLGLPCTLLVFALFPPLVFFCLLFLAKL